MSIAKSRPREGAKKEPRGSLPFVLSNFRAVVILCALTFVLPAAEARADGSTVRLTETSGRYVITVFTAPEPLRVGRADVSVLVQDRERGEPVLDGDVSIGLSVPASSSAAGAAITAAATHAQATNKLLYAAAMDLPVPGTWEIRVGMRHGDDAVDLRTDVVVAPEAPPLQAIWLYLLIPPVAIVLFALHQWRARRGADVHNEPPPHGSPPHDSQIPSSSTIAASSSTSAGS